jgi:hypothetical protein
MKFRADSTVLICEVQVIYIWRKRPVWKQLGIEAAGRFSK